MAVFLAVFLAVRPEEDAFLAVDFVAGAFLAVFFAVLFAAPDAVFLAADPERPAPDEALLADFFAAAPPEEADFLAVEADFLAVRPPEEAAPDAFFAVPEAGFDPAFDAAFDAVFEAVFLAARPLLVARRAPDEAAAVRERRRRGRR